MASYAMLLLSNRWTLHIRNKRASKIVSRRSTFRVSLYSRLNSNVRPSRFRYGRNILVKVAPASFEHVTVGGADSWRFVADISNSCPSVVVRAVVVS